MNEEHYNLLSRAFDEDLSPEELEEWNSIKDLPDLKEQWAELQFCRDALREDLEEQTKDVDFSNFYAGIEAQLPPPEKRSLWKALQKFWQNHWIPMLSSAAASAAVAFLVGHFAWPSVTDQDQGAVFVDAVKNNGPSTVYIDSPADPNQATVIWLTDEDDEIDEGDQAADAQDEEPI